MHGLVTAVRVIYPMDWKRAVWKRHSTPGMPGYLYLKPVQFIYSSVLHCVVTFIFQLEEKNRVIDDELMSVQREKESLQSELKESQDILSSVKSELEKLKVSLAAQEQIKKVSIPVHIYSEMISSDQYLYHKPHYICEPSMIIAVRVHPGPSC
jgi:septal ring factor EnvC (AmiA/AmiB activator)